MRRCNLAIVLGLVFLAGTVFAFNFEEAVKNQSTAPEKAANFSGWFASTSTDKAPTNAPVSATATLPKGKAYVRVSTALNIRTGPWGTITGTFSNNDAVEIIGTDGDWYIISLNGETRYIHSRYVSGKPGEVSSSSGSAVTIGTAAGSSTAAKVANAARDLVAKYSRPGSFPYAPATNGGTLGCAQVATTALMNAGVNTGIDLAVLGAIPKLKNLGWKEVKVPPYRAGDVITWRTYDRTGDGVKDDDTHIGIILENGSNVQAMSNSSSRKVPSIHSATYAPVCRVLRKV